MIQPGTYEFTNTQTGTKRTLRLRRVLLHREDPKIHDMAVYLKNTEGFQDPDDGYSIQDWIYMGQIHGDRQFRLAIGSYSYYPAPMLQSVKFCCKALIAAMDMESDPHGYMRTFRHLALAYEAPICAEA